MNYMEHSITIELVHMLLQFSLNISILLSTSRIVRYIGTIASVFIVRKPISGSTIVASIYNVCCHCARQFQNSLLILRYCSTKLDVFPSLFGLLMIHAKHQSNSYVLGYGSGINSVQYSLYISLSYQKIAIYCKFAKIKLINTVCRLVPSC